MKTLTVTLTERQLLSLMDTADDLESMIGAADDDTAWRSHVRNIDRTIKKAGYSRKTRKKI